MQVGKPLILLTERRHDLQEAGLFVTLKTCLWVWKRKTRIGRILSEMEPQSCFTDYALAWNSVKPTKKCSASSVKKEKQQIQAWMRHPNTGSKKEFGRLE